MVKLSVLQAGCPNNVCSSLIIVPPEIPKYISKVRSTIRLLFNSYLDRFLQNSRIKTVLCWFFCYSFPSSVWLSPSEALDYRLSGEARHPAQLLDALAGYAYLIDKCGIAPNRIVMFGDCAGSKSQPVLVMPAHDSTSPSFFLQHI